MASSQDVDLRPLLVPNVYHQGPRPLCLPFSVSTIHEVARAAGGSVPESLAPEAIWAHATARGKTSQYGMFLADADSALRDEGQPLLADWPYDTSVPIDEAGRRPPTLSAPPWFRSGLSALPLAFDGIEQPVEDALMEGNAVLLVVDVTDGFRFPIDGFIDISNADQSEGRHAVTCVGAATHPALGRCLLIRNSWGPGWAVGGYGWMTLRFLSQFGSEAAVAE